MTILTCAPPPSILWHRLVRRSVTAWKDLDLGTDERSREQMEEFLRHCNDLDDLLQTSADLMMFWFFQSRTSFVSQRRLTKWDPTMLDDLVLLPATLGFVRKTDCFFVSHFWESPQHPDPNGTYLNLLKDDLRQLEWSYIWVDWTCMPQDPRSPAEEKYFLRCLATVSAVIRNCGFIWRFPPWEPRLWILYEVAEFMLSGEAPTTGPWRWERTSDVKEYMSHVDEMLRVGASSVFEKYGYRCKQNRDSAYLTFWLELYVLLKKLRLSIDDTRRIMDNLTWLSTASECRCYCDNGLIEIYKYEGLLTESGVPYPLPRFPRWESGKFAARVL